LCWSFGGTVARFITVNDSWTVVFWRSFFAALFLLGFLLLRDGGRNTVQAFRTMGWPSILVAGCFAIASSAFVVALSYTTVANILLIQAGVPLLAALLDWLAFRQRITITTWAAIFGVILGVGIMVSNSFNGTVSPIGDGLALLIALAFSIAIVITRHHRGTRMVPANALAVFIALCVAATMADQFSVSWPDFAWLAAFGALNLGLGLALFSTGARMAPATLVALVGVLEPVLGPVWVWQIHNEVPDQRTIIGGTVVILALVLHLGYDWFRPEQA
jgi:drug/metabolite transporter (DMT)-like permease